MFFERALRYSKRWEQTQIDKVKLFLTGDWSTHVDKITTVAVVFTDGLYFPAEDFVFVCMMVNFFGADVSEVVATMLPDDGKDYATHNVCLGDLFLAAEVASR